MRSGWGRSLGEDIDRDIVTNIDLDIFWFLLMDKLYVHIL